MGVPFSFFRSSQQQRTDQEMQQKCFSPHQTVEDQQRQPHSKYPSKPPLSAGLNGPDPFSGGVSYSSCERVSLLSMEAAAMGNTAGNKNDDHSANSSPRHSGPQDDLYSWMAKQQEYTSSHGLQQTNKPTVTFTQVRFLFDFFTESKARKDFPRMSLVMAIDD